MSRVALHDPDNAHGVIYLWGTNGIGYNEKMVKALMPDAPLDSWRAGVRPGGGRRTSRSAASACSIPRPRCCARCCAYLGRDPNSQKAEDLAAAEETLLAIRPFIRNINSSEYIEALANGDLCIAVGYNGDVLQARDRAREANKGIEINYSMPKEGSILWFDMLAIPKDAPDIRRAPTPFINYIMTPKVIGRTSPISSATPTPMLRRTPLVHPAVVRRPGIYPTAGAAPEAAPCIWRTPPDQTRAITRVWQKFKTGPITMPTPSKPSKPPHGRIRSAAVRASSSA